MCREDLGLGRGRVLGNVATASGSADSVLPANPKRVAIIVTSIGVTTWDNLGALQLIDTLSIVFGPSNTGSVAMATACPFQPLVMRIEDYGSGITQPISCQIANGSGRNFCRFQEVISEVKQPPITE